MRTIWKFELEIADDPQTVEMPQGAEIVHVAAQNGVLCFWAIVEPSSPKEPRSFIVHGTGHPIGNVVRTYRGTALMRPFVWHVFEIL
jgi:hypothetical protein